ncbi:asparagine synthase-related protein [Anabaena azotica]|uniref:asparagine synthase (glutamine-hydrolyzing) n=1 Tax=Anabaena azotica FACHB-119 TaxID=947527 RepID=A0ABR8D319_9NOST|nr:asparagine synthase-related protein [Anabaena azotica]MBD2501124.1 asparagine synthase [Anabaena azotica FACHB-119]
MRAGFNVILSNSGEVEYHLFDPGRSSRHSEPLVSHAKNEQESLAVVLMGQLHYREELNMLLSHKRDVRNLTDAELILELFCCEGTYGLQRLQGEFSLVLWELSQQCLVVMRDPMGHWPLYWVCVNKIIRVSTSLLSLGSQISGISPNLDFLAAHLMAPCHRNEMPLEQTALEPCQRIRPGTMQKLYSNGAIELLWEWDWLKQAPDLKGITLPEAAEAMTQRLRAAIEQRSHRGTIAAHLSGGMDSSAVVCLARDLFESEESVKWLHTLSIDYQLPSLVGERRYIDMIVNQGGPIKPHFIHVDTILDFEWFQDDLPFHDEPFAFLHQISFWKLLNDAAYNLGASTILTGFGEELVFEGNQFYLADFIFRRQWLRALHEARRWAEALNASLWSILWEYALEPVLPLHLRAGIDILLRRNWGKWPDNLGKYSIPPWLKPTFADAYDLPSKSQQMIKQLFSYPLEHRYIPTVLQGCAGDWVSWFLAAPLGMTNSQPFLDPRLLTFGLALPLELRENPSMKRPVFQMAMQGILPEPIRTRKYKCDYNERYWAGLNQNLASLEDMIHRSQIDELGIFDKEMLLRVLRDHAVGIGGVTATNRISNSLAVIAWYDQLDRGLHMRLKPEETYHLGQPLGF